MYLQGNSVTVVAVIRAADNIKRRHTEEALEMENENENELISQDSNPSPYTHTHTHTYT